MTESPRTSTSNAPWGVLDLRWGREASCGGGSGLSCSCSRAGNGVFRGEGPRWPTLTRKSLPKENPSLFRPETAQQYCCAIQGRFSCHRKVVVLRYFSALRGLSAQRARAGRFGVAVTNWISGPLLGCAVPRSWFCRCRHRRHANPDPPQQTAAITTVTRVMLGVNGHAHPSRHGAPGKARLPPPQPLPLLSSQLVGVSCTATEGASEGAAAPGAAEEGGAAPTPSRPTPSSSASQCKIVGMNERLAIAQAASGA